MPIALYSLRFMHRKHIRRLGKRSWCARIISCSLGCRLPVNCRIILFASVPFALIHTHIRMASESGANVHVMKMSHSSVNVQYVYVCEYMKLYDSIWYSRWVYDIKIINKIIFHYIPGLTWKQRRWYCVYVYIYTHNVCMYILNHIWFIIILINAYMYPLWND